VRRRSIKLDFNNDNPTRLPSSSHAGLRCYTELENNCAKQD
jgi:hypothetical protein